jgi:RNA polymerase sigma-70 factor (ECF subfamily)
MIAIFNDKNLVKRLRKGDIKAFSLLYNKYSRKLYAFGFKFLQSKVETEDLIQSLFLKIWKNRKELNIELPFKSYLYTITYKDICKQFRKRQFHRNYLNYLTNEFPKSYSIDEVLECKSLLGDIQNAIEHLSVKRQRIFVKSRIEGKTSKEIASELDIAPGTVDNYISSTTKILKRKFTWIDNKET